MAWSCHAGLSVSQHDAFIEMGCYSNDEENQSEQADMLFHKNRSLKKNDLQRTKDDIYKVHNSFKALLSFK